MVSTVTTRPSAREQTLKCLDRLPKMSPLMTQLLGRLSRRDCDIEDLTNITEKDPVLAAQILQLSNSAIFGRLRPVTSVRHAIAMLGISTLRKFALGSSITNLFSRTKPAQTFSLVRFNMHSVATATLVELLAEKIDFEDGTDAFLAGLLHDIGKLLIAVNFPRMYDDILATVAMTNAPLIEVERDLIGIDHAELSGLAISRWGLSEGVQWAANDHHAPVETAPESTQPPQKVRLSAGVQSADLFVNHLGMGILPVPLASQKTDDLAIPGITFPKDQVLSNFEREVKSLGEMFR